MIVSASVLPSTYSMTMESRPSSETMSWMVTILGWLRAEAACASRSRRRRRSRSQERDDLVGSDPAAGFDLLPALRHPRNTSSTLLRSAAEVKGFWMNGVSAVSPWLKTALSV